MIYFRLTFWSRHSTKVRTDLDAKDSDNDDQKEGTVTSDSCSKTKLQLAIEAAEFLYEPKKWRT